MYCTRIYIVQEVLYKCVYIVYWYFIYHFIILLDTEYLHYIYKIKHVYIDSV